MASTNQSADPSRSDGIPKRGPAWTLYVYVALAALLVLGLIYGFQHAGVVR